MILFFRTCPLYIKHETMNFKNIITLWINYLNNKINLNDVKDIDKMKYNLMISRIQFTSEKL